MICLETAAGYLVVSVPQPADVSLCQMVVVSAADMATPWNLTIAEAETVGALVVGVWVTAWVFRMVIRSLGGKS